jgi:hypothetical protein
MLTTRRVQMTQQASWYDEPDPCSALSAVDADVVLENADDDGYAPDDDTHA